MQRSDALSRLLKSYRLEAGMTQQELADHLGVVQTLVSKVESRERRLDLIELQVYLQPLGRSVHELIDELDEQAPDIDASLLADDTPAQLIVSGTELSLSVLLRRLDEALAAEKVNDVGSAELVVSLLRDDAGVGEAVIDLSGVPAKLRNNVAEAVRDLGDAR